MCWVIYFGPQRYFQKDPNTEFKYLLGTGFHLAL